MKMVLEVDNTHLAIKIIHQQSFYLFHSMEAQICSKGWIPYRFSMRISISKCCTLAPSL